jgi:hypothetical protein
VHQSEVSLTKFSEFPTIFNFFGKASWLVTLGISSNIDIEPLIFRHCLISAVTSHMIFSNMSGVVSIFFQSFRNGYGLRSYILTLTWAGELGFFFGDAWLSISVQVSDYINAVVYSCRILPRKHGGTGWSTVWLGVSMSKTQALVGNFFNIGSDERTSVSSHSDLVCTDLIPT